MLFTATRVEIHDRLLGCSDGEHTNYFGFSNRLGNVLLKGVHNLQGDEGWDSLTDDNMSSEIFSDDYVDERNTFDGGNSSVLLHFNNASHQMDVDSGGDCKDKDYQAYYFSSGEN
jgi:hypothetical protein